MHDYVTILENSKNGYQMSLLNWHYIAKNKDGASAFVASR